MKHSALADQIKALEAEMRSAQSAQKDTEQALEHKRRALEATCTHRYDDGTSALSGGMFCDTCNICHANNW